MRLPVLKSIVRAPSLIYARRPRQAGLKARATRSGGHVDVALLDGRSFLMGDQFTTADILLTTCLTWAVDYGVDICDSAVSYLERTTGRPAYLTASKVNFANI